MGEGCGKVLADRGQRVAMWAKDAVRVLAVATAESDRSEGRDADEDASDTAAAAAEDDVETVDEEDDTAEASLPTLLFPLASPSPSPVPVAMQSRGRSGIWSATGYHFVGYKTLAGTAGGWSGGDLEWNGGSAGGRRQRESYLYKARESYISR